MTADRTSSPPPVAKAMKRGHSNKEIWFEARLKLTELVPAAVEAFYANEIGVSHALLLAKLPAEQQKMALSACFKEAVAHANHTD